MTAFDRVWYWRKLLPERKGQRCRIVDVVAWNTCLIEFEDGYQVTAHVNTMRRIQPAYNALVVGEARAVMREMPERSVQCCVTSIPYWGLRDYGIDPVEWADGASCVYGQEPTPEAFIAHSVEVFAELKRVLRDDGTLWLNIGDSYAAHPNNNSGPSPTSTLSNPSRQFAATPDDPLNRLEASRLKAGDLCNMPHRIAAALQADGWYWRSTVIWSKRSPMPESVRGWRWRRCRRKVAPAQRNVEQADPNGNRRYADGVAISDAEQAVWVECPGCKKCTPNGGYILRRGKWRPTTAHEYVFLFSRSNRYFCDGDAVQERAAMHPVDWNADGTRKRDTKARGSFGGKHTAAGKESFRVVTPQRNPRTVWTLSSEPYKGAHFATFPTMLVKRCVEAGTSAAGCCPKCLASYAPIVDSSRVPTRSGDATKYEHDADRLTIGNRDPKRHVAVTQIV
ncbi:MAG: DNA methyltransferase, partial [Pirellulales bacterium]